MATTAKLQARVRTQRETIKQKDIEIQKLKAALRAFTSEETDDDLDLDSDIDILDDVALVPQQADTPHPENEEMQTDASSLVVLPEPIWVDGVHFESEGIYICTDCAAEVVDGQCFLCGLEHQWEDDPHQKGATTDTQAINSDRSLVPRGNTPLLEVDDDFSPPLEYNKSRVQEYMELLERGATRLMCEAFHLEYTYNGGIFAWADPVLYEAFAGPAMKKGDFWKIHLGRRVVLDDDDLDGSAFIEGLLEDALYFPLRGEGSKRKFEKWETVQETLGIWVTRLQDTRIDEDGDGDNEDAKSGSSDDDDYERQVGEACQLEEEALEDPDATDDTVNRIIRVDEYDTVSEVSEEDDDEMDDSDPGYSWEANVPDAVWKNDEENSQESDDHTMSGSESDDFDSDTDSDEIVTDDDL